MLWVDLRDRGGTPYEANVVYVKNFAQTEAKPLFLHKDYLGTLLAITDEKGTVVEERHFDAWGNLTHGSMQVLDRGYTSHEHLQDVGLIHMNGRLYDPMLRRFLNADENIQDPTNTQCYNKYGYVMNNPLMFSDPDGEYAVGLAIAIGALVAVLSYTVTIYARDGSLRHWKLGDAYVSAIYGAFSGAVTFSVGSIFSAAGGTATALAESIKGVAGGAGLAVVQAGAHAVTQGVLSSVQGGNFWSAALSGAFGSLGASAFGAIGGNFARSTVGTITFGAISGGIGAELSGGNFWQGVVIGGMVAGLNHVMHSMAYEEDGIDISTLKKSLSEADIKKIMDAYPTADKMSALELYKTIGGDIYKDVLQNGLKKNGTLKSSYKNTCCFRLSKALNDSGFTIAKSDYTMSGKNNLNYYFATKYMGPYLMQTYNFGSSMKNYGLIIQTGCGWSDASGHVDVFFYNRIGIHSYPNCSTTNVHFKFFL